MSPTAGYSITVLREGTCEDSFAGGSSLRRCNTVLLRGPAGIIVVNPGSVWDCPNLISALKQAGVASPEVDVNYVVCTDGRAEHVGCMGIFQGAMMMIVGYDIQQKGDLFLKHDFEDGVVPYEFDEFLYAIGTPGKRGSQVSLMVRGWLTDASNDESEPPVSRIAITGPLFTDELDAGQVSFFETPEHDFCDNKDKHHSWNSWRRSRQYILDRADWIIPGFGRAFKVQPEFSSTPCVELA